MFTRLRIFLNKWITQELDKKTEDNFELFREDIIELSKVVNSKFQEIESKYSSVNNSEDIITLNTILKKALRESTTDLQLEDINSTLDGLKKSIDYINLNINGFKNTLEQFPKDVKTIQTSLDKNKNIHDNIVNELSIKIDLLNSEVIEIGKKIKSMEYLIPLASLISETNIVKTSSGEIKGVSLTQDVKQSNMNKSIILPNGTTIFLKSI